MSTPATYRDRRTIAVGSAGRWARNGAELGSSSMPPHRRRPMWAVQLIDARGLRQIRDPPNDVRPSATDVLRQTVCLSDATGGPARDSAPSRGCLSGRGKLRGRGAQKSSAGGALRTGKRTGAHRRGASPARAPFAALKQPLRPSLPYLNRLPPPQPTFRVEGLVSRPSVLVRIVN